MVAGVFAEIVAWRLVVARRASVWVVTAPVLAAMGALSLVVREPEAGGAAWGGLAAGVGVFLLTRLAVGPIGRWRRFGAHVAELYRRRGGLALPAAVALAVVAAAGEELFWRGLFQARLSASIGEGAGAVATWAAFAAANAASANLAVVAAALVGGAVWAWLALQTGGFLASAVCHATWTALMLVAPPGEGRDP